MGNAAPPVLWLPILPTPAGLAQNSRCLGKAYCTREKFLSAVENGNFLDIFSSNTIYWGGVKMRKKRLILIFMILCVLTVASCRQTDADNGAKGYGDETGKAYTDTEWLKGEIHHISDRQTRDFDVQYVRAGVKSGHIVYPAVKIIRSVEELNQYLQNETYMPQALMEACEKYDRTYFEEQLLIMLLLEEGSGSIRHEVERIGVDGENTVIEIKSIVPEACTCDMAYWHILIEPETGMDIANDDDVVVFLDGRNATEKLTVIYYEKGYANISVTLKEGWAYDIVDEADSVEFSVSIYPAGQPQNKLRIAYFNGFGVCGTGLKQEKIRLGNYDAWMGTYDDNRVWDFISMLDTFGDYAILNEGGEKWWKEYGEEAMQILATVTIADGYVSEAQAVQVARDKAGSTDEGAEVHYDSAENVWKVTLSGKNTTGDDTFVIDVHGNIIEIIGEK